MNSLLLFDQSITLFFKNIIPHNIFLNIFFSFFSLKGSSILIWILIIIGVAILEEKKYPGISKKDKKFIVLFTVSLFLTFLFADVGLKNLFHRPRPIMTNFNQLQLILTNSCPKDYSFPSGHAATAFAAATILAYFDKKRRWFYYIVAILISYSRIFLGCHYFLDVIFGALMGYIISRLFLFVLDTSPFRKKN